MTRHIQLAHSRNYELSNRQDNHKITDFTAVKQTKEGRLMANVKIKCLNCKRVIEQLTEIKKVVNLGQSYDYNQVCTCGSMRNYIAIGINFLKRADDV